MTVLATYRVDSGPGAGGVALIALRGDIDGVFDAMGIGGVGIGEAKVRDLCGVDRGLVVRWGGEIAHLTPHGGGRIVRKLCEELERRGLVAGGGIGWPEAEDEIEAMMLEALSRSASPMAIDSLLAQPVRWRGWDSSTHPADEIDRHSRSLSRLIDPPTVVAIGPPNIGKSTLLNALAQRHVALVADEPGVTRDHVGALVDLGGLVVRWVDTAGIDGDGDAVAILTLVGDADLVISCGDAGMGFVEGVGDGGSLAVGLRADLGRTPDAALWVSAMTGDGMAALCQAVRERLVPCEALAWDGPWAFCDELCERIGAGLD